MATALVHSRSTSALRPFQSTQLRKVRIAPRPAPVSVQAPARNVHMVVAAKRREIEPVPFPEIYMTMVERPDGMLPKGDGTVMMASIR